MFRFTERNLDAWLSKQIVISQICSLTEITPFYDYAVNLMCKIIKYECASIVSILWCKVRHPQCILQMQIIQD